MILPRFAHRRQPGTSMSPAVSDDLRMETGPDGTFRLLSRQWLPAPLEQVFPFFADAFQLETLTPDWLKFQVLTPPPIAMRVGLRIDYRLRLHRIPVRWQSEITEWEPGRRFVDEQRRGPYKRWRHLHLFESVDGGTAVLDDVAYAVYGGRLVNRLCVQPDLERIFAFRRRKLAEIFAPRTPASR